MIKRNLRFVNDETAKEFLEINPISNKEQDLMFDKADKRSYKLMHSFATIEDYLTRHIYGGLGVHNREDVWRANSKSYKEMFSKIFSSKDRQDIMKSMVDEGYIKDTTNKMIRLPTDFRIEKNCLLYTSPSPRD